MRKTVINTEVESTKVLPGTGEINLPASQVVHYKGVGQVLREADGLGVVSYHEARAAADAAEVKQWEQRLQTSRATELILNRDMQLQLEIDAWKQNNPSMEGLTEFASSRYLELTNEALSESGNQVTYGLVEKQSRVGLFDISNKSYGEEDAQRKANELSALDMQVQGVYNRLYESPEEYNSLLAVYNPIKENIRSVDPKWMAANERKLDDGFAISFVRGEINKNPGGTMSMLHQSKMPGPLAHMLTVDSLSKMKREARAEFTARQVGNQDVNEILKARLSVELDKKGLELKDAYKTSLSKAMSLRSEIEEDGGIPEAKKIKLLAKADVWEAEYAEMRKHRDAVIESSENGTRLPAWVEDKYVVSRWKEAVQSEEQRLERPLTCLEQYEICQFDGALSSRENKVLRQQLIDNLRYSQEPEKIIDAAQTIQVGSQSKVLGRVDYQDLKLANDVLACYFAGSSRDDPKSGLDVVVNSRDRFSTKVEQFTISERSAEYRKQVKDAKKHVQEKLEDKFKGQGIDIVYSHYGAALLDAHKKEYLRTGLMQDADTIIDLHADAYFKRTKMNGKDEIMYLPPTGESLGVSQSVVDGLLNNEARRMLNAQKTLGTKVVVKGTSNIPVIQITDEGLIGLESQALEHNFKYKPVTANIDGRDVKLYFDRVPSKDVVVSWYYHGKGWTEKKKLQQRIYLKNAVGSRYVTNLTDLVKRLSVAKQPKESKEGEQEVVNAG